MFLFFGGWKEMGLVFGIRGKEKYICRNLKMDEYEEMLFENGVRKRVGSDVFVWMLGLGVGSEKRGRGDGGDRV